MFVARKMIALAAVAMIVAPAGRAEATEKLRKELTVIATNLSKALKGMEETSVAMGEFKGEGAVMGAAGDSPKRPSNLDLRYLLVAGTRPSRNNQKEPSSPHFDGGRFAPHPIRSGPEVHGPGSGS